MRTYIKINKFDTVSYPSAEFYKLHDKINELYAICEPEYSKEDNYKFKPHIECTMLLGYDKKELVAYMGIVSTQKYIEKSKKYMRSRKKLMEFFTSRGGIEGKHGHFLINLCTNTAYKGLGTQMMKHYFKTIGKVAYSFLHIDPKRKTAMEFFYKHGYEKVGTYKDDIKYVVMRRMHRKKKGGGTYYEKYVKYKTKYITALNQSQTGGEKEYLPYSWEIDGYPVILDTGAPYMHASKKTMPLVSKLTSPKGKQLDITTRVFEIEKDVILIGRRALIELQNQGYVIGPYKEVVNDTIYLRALGREIPTLIDSGSSSNMFAPVVLENNKLGKEIYDSFEGKEKTHTMYSHDFGDVEYKLKNTKLTFIYKGKTYTYWGIIVLAPYKTIGKVFVIRDLLDKMKVSVDVAVIEKTY